MCQITLDFGNFPNWSLIKWWDIIIKKKAGINTGLVWIVILQYKKVLIIRNAFNWLIDFILTQGNR